MKFSSKPDMPPSGDGQSRQRGARHKAASQGSKKDPNKRSEAPEVVPPHLTQALETLEARQAQEWAALNKVEALAKLMDAQFIIPFLPIRLGLDTLIGLLPGIGDTISFGVSGFIIVQAKRMGANPAQISRMLFVSFIDWLIGLVPVIGDIFDIGWRSNIRNTDYLREIMESKWARERAELLRS